MSVAAPHYLLFSEANRRDRAGAAYRRGWRFVLESVDGQGNKVEAADEEPHTTGDRLDLLAVVRGLEALDQPSRVTLVTQSRYVSEGMRYGLADWRESEWQWERYGKMVPVKNGDLWRRVDRALRIHQVECRVWRFDKPDAAADLPTGAGESKSSWQAEALPSEGWAAWWRRRNPVSFRALWQGLRRFWRPAARPH